MDERTYRRLKTIAILMTVGWVGWTLYDSFSDKDPASFAYHAGSNYFADGHYEQALTQYQEALDEDPNFLPARRGIAETLIILNREREAVDIFKTLIADYPDNAGFYANLGIAYDRLGEHRKALEHYEKAVQLDQEAGSGPNWLTRFLRNQPEKPPGIIERAIYLREQFELPADQRVLRLPELDDNQRPYKE